MFNLRFFSSLLFCLFVHIVCFAAPPGNDDVAGAITLFPSFTSNPISGDLTDATKSTANPALNIPATNNIDVWFTFTASAVSQTISIVGGTGLKPAFQIFTGTAGTLIKIGTGNAYTSTTTTSLSQTIPNLTIGTVYFIRFYQNSLTPPTNKTFTIEVLTPPANDECAGAIDIIPSKTCTPINGDLFGATSSNPPASNNYKDVWYTFTATTKTHYFNINGIGNITMAIEVDSLGCGTGNKNIFYAPSTNTDTLLAVYPKLTVGKKYYYRIFNYNTSVTPTNTSFTTCIEEFIPNDDCTGAIEIIPDKSQTCTYYSGKSLAATKSSQIAGTGCNGNANDDVWYKFKATSTSHWIKIQGASNYNVEFQVFANSCSGTTLSCTDVSGNGKADSVALSPLTIGNEYFIRVYDDANSTTTPYFSICIFTPPVNDNCNGALTVTPGLSCSAVSGNGTYASNSLASSLGTANDDLWYKFIPDTSVAFIQVYGSQNYNPVVEVYDGCGGAALTGVNAIDDASFPKSTTTTSFGSKKISGLTKGKTYYYRVFDFEQTNPANSTMDFNTCVINPSKNDECNKAFEVKHGNSCSEVVSDGTYASVSLPAKSLMGDANDDVWFKFVADTTVAYISVTPPADYNPVVQLFSDCSATPTAFTPSFYDDASYPKGGFGTSRVTGLEKGKTYYYRVYDFESNNPSTMLFTTCVVKPVSNDDCTSAKNIVPGNTCKPIDGNGAYASEYSPAMNGNGNANDDVWFSFKATSTSQYITVNSSLMYDPVVQVFNGCSKTPTNASSLLNNDLDFGKGSTGVAKVSGLTIGTTYYYRVYDKGGNPNPVTMTFSTCVTNPPINDDCLTASTVFPDVTCNAIIGNATYASESIAASCGGKANDDIWYKFTAQSTNQFISVTPDDQSYDPIIEVYSACATNTTPTKLAPAFCEDTKYPVGKFGNALLTNLTPSKDYYYRIYDANNVNQDTMTISTCVTNATKNDDCIGALTVTPGTTCNSVDGDGTYATKSLSLPANSEDDVWFTFTATKTTQFISITPDDPKYDPIIDIYSSCGTTPISIGSNDANFPAGKFGTFAVSGLTLNKQYWYRVYDKAQTSQAKMTFKTCVVEPVSNNDCEFSTPITPGVTSSNTTGDGTYATQSLPAGTCGQINAANDDIWYRFDAVTTKEFISVNAPVGYDPVVEVYKNACGTASILCEDANYPTGGFGTKSFTTEVGKTYFYRIYDKNTSNTYPMSLTTSVVHAPINDDCSGALQVSAGLTCNPVDGDGTYANESLVAASGLGNANDDVWYYFTATNTSQTIYVKSSKDYDPVVQLFTSNCTTTFPATGTTSTNDIRFPLNGDGSWNITGLTVGSKYYYRVYDKSNTSTTPPASPLTFTTCVTTPALPPDNDEPCKATLITPSTTCNYTTYTNDAATTSVGPPAPGCANYSGGDVWFKMKVPFSGKLDFETKSGVITDIGMAIYSGSCNNLTLVDCDYDGSTNTGLMSKISLSNLTPGDTLRIRIWEYNNDNNGTFGLCVTKIAEAPLVGPCNNLDFENNLDGWFGTTGSVVAGQVNKDPSPIYKPNLFNTLTPPTCFQIQTTGIDPFGGFPVAYKGKSVRLGNNANGNKGQSLEQYFTVTKSNATFIYHYAAVLHAEDPTKHTPEQQPFFKAEFFDDNGKQISCGDYLVVAFSHTGPNKDYFISPKDANYYYKPWTTVGVNLSQYIGQNVHVRFTTTSCYQTGHQAQVYLDCECAPFEIIKPAKICLGDTATLYAPKGGLSYEWKDALNNVVSTSDSLFIVPKTVGTFDYKCYIGMFGTSLCLDSLPTKLEVGASPTLKITDPSPICLGATVDLTKKAITDGSTPNLIFSYWKNQAATIPITNQTAFNESGTYYIKGQKSATCQDIQPVKVVINPAPKIADTTAIICSDDSLKLLPLLSLKNVIPADTKYKWTIETNSSNITGQSTEVIGKSDIKNKLSNKVNTAQKIKYKITPFTPTCEGTPFYFEITVNPKPQIKDSTSSICTNTPFNIAPINLRANVVPAGTTYTWIFKENTNVTNESNSATDESAIKSYTQNLINTTNTIQPVEHRVAPKSGTCVGDTFKVIINVNPAPKIPDSLKSICTNTAFDITPVHTGTRFIIPSGTTYTWATPTLSGAIVGGSAQTNQTTISQTLINNTTTNQTATYAITANSNTLPNCSSSFNGVITVEPKIKPVITCGSSSSTTLEFTWADIPGATSYEYVYKVGAAGTLSSPPQSISAGISPRITSTTINSLSAGNNVYFTLTPVGILCPLPETKLCSNCAQPTIVNTVATSPTDFEICVGETITLKASVVPNNTSQWSIITNNIVSNSIKPSKDLMDITGLKAGTTDIEFENNTGCKNSITVTVNPKPEIAKIIKSICYGGLFDTIPNNNILTTNVVPTGTTYTWAPVTTVSNVTGITTGSAESSFKQNLTNGTNISKVIDYKVKATSGVAPNTCSNDFDVSITLNPTPKIAAINKVLCSTDAFDTIPNNTFLSTNIVPSGTTYTWDLPTLLSGINGATAENTNTKTSFKQTLTNTTTNPINVSYSVTAKSGSIPDQCTSTFNTTLTVNPTPKIDNITLAICSGETFDTIPDNSSPNSIPTGTKYTWNIGLPPTGISGISAGTDQSSIKQSLKNTTANPIDVIYSITATSGVAPNQCSKTFTLTATVNPIPKIITVDTIKICENIKTFNQFNLNETGGIASKWEWSSNLTTSLAIIDNQTTTNPSVKNGINGEAFKVIGTDINGCKNSDTTILKILPLPIFTPSVDTACVNGKLTFKAKLPSQKNYSTYLWNYPIGSTGIPTNTLETFNINPVSIINAGKYYITVTDINFCSKKDSVTAIVHPLPVFTPSYTLPCENKPLILRSNYKKGVSYVWTGPNTFTHNSIIDSVKITTIAIPATHTGDYFVEITDTNKCVKKEKVSVIIYPKPKVTATNSGPICANVTSFTLDETATDVISWNWSSNRFAKFNKSLEQPLVTLASDGEIFKVVGKDVHGCVDSATTTIIINPVPVITPKEVCVDNRVILTATHTPASIVAWKSENVGIATINPTTGEMLGIAAGKGKIVYLDDKGCSDTSIVTINALPKITTSPLEVCEESTLQLKANHPASPLNPWNSAITSYATISTTGLVQGIKTGVSSIEFKDSKGCTTKEDLIVNIKPIAEFKALYESICITDSLFLIDKSKPLSHTYIWSFGDGLSSNHNAHKYQTNGIFDITLVTITDKGCMDTMTKNKYIEVIGLPKVAFSFTPDSIDIFDPQIRFMNHSDAKHYTWVFGDGLPTSVHENPTHTFPATTGQHYTVTLTGYNTENGCSTSYSQIIVAKEPLIYYIPNTFTPNGDEYNNSFKPIFYSGLDVYNYHFTIYNRWGEVIFESFNVDFGWDGTYGNQIVETATYIWKLEFKEKNKENTHSKTGHVNVLR
jgi:gliding motility-associated-like protein